MEQKSRDSMKFENVKKPDFAILAPNDYEYEHLKRIVINMHIIEDAPFPYEMCFGLIGKYNVLCVKSGKGTVPTSACFEAVYTSCKPRYVIVIGIAAGNSDNNLIHGDVIVPQYYIGYQRAKIAESGQYVSEFDYSFHPDQRLFVHAQKIEQRSEHKGEWQKYIKESRPESIDSEKSKLPKIDSHYSLSGDLLIDDPTNPFVIDVIGKFKDFSGVEMEVAGLSTGLRNKLADHLVGVIMIRGISDILSPTEMITMNEATKKEFLTSQKEQRRIWKSYATSSAVAFLEYFLNTFEILKASSGPDEFADLAEKSNTVKKLAVDEIILKVSNVYKIYVESISAFIKLKEYSKVINIVTELLLFQNLTTTNRNYFLLLRAHMYMSLNNYIQAQNDIEQVIAIDDNNNYGLLMLSFIYANIGKMDSAIINITKVINNKFDLAKSYYMRGLYNEILGNSFKAIKDFRTCIDFDNKNYDAHCHLGVLYRNSGKIKESIKYFTNAIDINDKNYIAYNQRGETYMLINYYNKASKDFDKVINIDPTKSVYAYANKASIIGREKDYNGALGYINKAITLRNDEWSFYTERGSLFYQLEKYDEALEEFNFALGLNPNSTITLLNRCNTYLVKGDYQAAINDAKTATNVNPNDAHSFFTLARVSSINANKVTLSECVLNISKAINISPDTWYFYEFRSKLFTKLGEHLLASKDKDKSKELNVRNVKYPNVFNYTVLY